MKTEFFIAKRHLLERKFQTIMSILAVCISLTVFLVSLAISNGLKDNMVKSLLSLTPHISVLYDINNEKEGQYLSDNEKVEKIKNVVDTTPIINTKGIIKTNDSISAFLVKGVDPNFFNLKLYLGQYPKELTEILIGYEYAMMYGINISDKLNLTLENDKQVEVVVSGIFKTGFYDYDMQVCLIPIKTAQILLETGDKITELGINIKNPTNTKQLNSITNSLNDFNTTNWAIRNQNLMSAIEFEKFVLISLLTFLLVISTFIISVILNMIIREKITDIGIMKAFGYTNKVVRNIFLMQAVIIGVLGILISAIISPVIMKIMQKLFQNFITSTYYIDKLPMSLNISEILSVYLFAFTMIIISAYFPVRKAYKMEPHDAIRYN